LLDQSLHLFRCHPVCLIFQTMLTTTRQPPGKRHGNNGCMQQLGCLGDPNIFKHVVSETMMEI
jgi:hypothetical protein